MANTNRMVKVLILGLSVSLSTMAVAAGYGVQGQKEAQSQAINTLLKGNNRMMGSMITPSDTASIVAPRPVVTRSKNNANKNAVRKNQVFGATSGSQEAFTTTAHNLMPLSPAQIRTLHELFSRSQQAASQYPGTPPKPTSSTVLVNLSPGAAPPIVRLRSGFVTSIVFLDSTGQPWPVVAYDIGDPKAFNLEPNQPNGKSNTLLVQALDNYKSGNLAVMLKGEDTPIMITLMPGQRAVDYRVDMRVPGLGPEAKPTVSGLPATGNPQLINFLDGVPPQGATALVVSGGASQAWLYGNKLFLRTRLTVLSPSWLSTMSSPDGTHVYELAKAPVVLASERGQMVNLAIKGL